MKRYTLRHWIFMALCCALGLAAKKLISPAANLVTGFLHIPGGIGTSFSLLFLVIAAALVELPGCAALIGAVQSILALGLGMVGSMGVLAPIGYIVPGIVIDLIFLLSRKTGLGTDLTLTLANMLGAAAAGLTANLIVFHLPGVPLALYIVVALASGAVCGGFAGVLIKRLRPVISASRASDFEEQSVSMTNPAQGHAQGHRENI